MAHGAAYAASAAEISRDAQAALNAPVREGSSGQDDRREGAGGARLPERSRRPGLGIGGQYGDGALIKRGKTVAYYNTTGVSSGLQAGAQQYGYAMFFMNDGALETARQDRRLRGWRRSQHRRDGRREGQVHDDHIGEGRHLRVHLQSEGFNGRARSARQQDHEDRCQVGESRPINSGVAQSPIRL